jgi:hypothetical protein
MQPNEKFNKLENNAIVLKKLGIGKKMFMKKMQPIVKKPKSKFGK